MDEPRDEPTDEPIPVSDPEPNWLDTAGHSCGTVGVRWVGPDVVDVLPSTRVVPLASLSSPSPSPSSSPPSSS